MATGASPAGSCKVRKLRTVLHAKAKEEPGRRFRALIDKVWRTDFLTKAWVLFLTISRPKFPELSRLGARTRSRFAPFYWRPPAAGADPLQPVSCRRELSGPAPLGCFCHQLGPGPLERAGAAGPGELCLRCRRSLCELPETRLIGKESRCRCPD